MTGPIVCDASAVIAMLLDDGPIGTEAARVLGSGPLAAPALVTFEVANILRRHERAGLIGRDLASQAHADLVDLAIEFWPYDVIAARVWELRHNLTSYDAGYVAVAELLDAPLVTLDHRLARAAGVRCRIRALGAAAH